MQKKQKIPFKIDVIFNAFNVFILSPLRFIIPHRRLNVNVFAKKVCPILTAAEGFVVGVGVMMFTINGSVIEYDTTANVTKLY